MIWILIALQILILTASLICYVGYRKQGEDAAFIRYDGKRLGWQKFWTPFGFWLVRRLPIREKGKGCRNFCEHLSKTTEDPRTREAYRDYLGQRMGEILAVFFLCCGLLAAGLSAERKPIAFDGTVARREYAQGDSKLLVQAEIQQGQEKISKEIELEVPEQEASQEQKERWLGESAEYISSYFRDHGPYTEEPSFPTSWGKASYSYYSEEPEIMQNDGRLLISWPEEDTSISLRIVTWVEGLSTSQSVEIQLVGAKNLPAERQLELLQKEINEGKFLEEKEVVLPAETAGGDVITWNLSDTQINPWLFGCIGLLILLLFWIRGNEKLGNTVKKQRGAILRTYPEAINQMVILMGAGLTLQNAWLRVTEKYERRKKEKERMEPLYEAMNRVSVRTQNGLSFSEALRELGDSIQVKEVRKFIGLMLAERKRGDEHLLDYLKQMNEEAWEQRKKQVKEKTEEADTRLLFPLMMMLVVILIVVLAPAIMTIQG